MSKTRVQQLIDQQENISNEILAKALAKAAEEESKRLEKVILRAYNAAKEGLEAEVDKLRNLRRLEKSVRKNVLACDKAMQQFMKDGDIEALKKGFSEVGIGLFI